MKKLLLISAFIFIFSHSAVNAQEVQTLFKSSGPSGGYGALSNKFTFIRGEYANLCEVYGGWFIRKRFLLGIGGAASTNFLQVPAQFSEAPLRKMSWEYGQFGLMTEYVFWSNRVIHVNLSLFTGAGFTLQYERTDWEDWDNDNFDDYHDIDHDENFFYVIEPGVQVEVNVFKWMRLSPGVSYRNTFGSTGSGLRDSDLSDWSYNITLKFGKF